MKEIIKQYAGGIVAILLGICLIGILVRQTMLDTVYGGEITDSLQSVETVAFDTYMEGGNLTMSVREKEIRAGEKIPATDLFQVWDVNGNPGLVEVLKVYGEDGCGVDAVSTEKELQYLCFPSEGVYTLYLSIAVKEHKPQFLEVNVPVQCA